MFSRFTTVTGGALYIRAEDIRRLQDIPYEDDNHRCWVCWMEDSERCSELVQGTADENLKRLIAEGRAALNEAERSVQRGRMR